MSRCGLIHNVAIMTCKQTQTYHISAGDGDSYNDVDRFLVFGFVLSLLSARTKMYG